MTTKDYRLRRREIDKARRSTPEGKAEQLRIRKERIEALKRAKVVGEWDDFVRKEAKDLCKVRLVETKMAWDPDHMIPLRAKTVSGLDCGDNIQVIPAILNRKKKNLLLYTQRNEWLKHIEVKNAKRRGKKANTSSKL